MGTPVVDVEVGIGKINKERKKGLQFIFRGWFVIFAVFYLLCAVSRPIDYLFQNGFNENTFSEVRVYVHQDLDDPIARVAFLIAI